MVLWEITLATAYWLGIRKTYKLALKLQRRLIGPKHPRIRDFVQRRTRPSAKIRGPPSCHHENAGQKKLSAGRDSGDKGSTAKAIKSNMGPDKVLFSQYVNKSPLAQTISNRINAGIGRKCLGLQDTKSISGHRPFTAAGLAWEKSGSSIPIAWRGSSFEKGIFRNDIAQWMGKKQ